MYGSSDSIVKLELKPSALLYSEFQETPVKFSLTFISL